MIHIPEPYPCFTLHLALDIRREVIIQEEVADGYHFSTGVLTLTLSHTHFHISTSYHHLIFHFSDDEDESEGFLRITALVAMTVIVILLVAKTRA